MKQKPLETAATIGLGVVCAALIFHLIVRVRDVHAGAPPAPIRNERSLERRVAPAHANSIPGGESDAFPKGPVLNLALYREGQSESLRPPDRDPFSFPPTPRQLQQNSRQRAARAAEAVAVAAPPPPPPIPFQAVGYSIKAQGTLEAYLADSQRVYVVHEGDKFDKSYRVVMITPAMIEIEDESLRRTVEIPFPQ